MRRVTVIGSGNAFNTDGRAHACYLLESSAGENLLLDFGATSLQQLQKRKFDFGQFPFVLLTHFHGDHFSGLPFLLLELELVLGRTTPLVIAGPPGVRERCSALMECMYQGFLPKLKLPLEFVEVTGPVQLGSFHIQPFPIRHQPESTGYRVSGPAGRSFAFSGDASCDESLFDLVRGVDVAVVELSMFRQTDPPTAHVSLEEVERLRDRFQCGRLIWSHIYDELAAAVATRGLGETAVDGLEILFEPPGPG